MSKLARLPREFERIVRRMGQFPGLKQAIGQFFRKEEKEGRHALHELRKIAAAETLHTHGAHRRGRCDCAEDIHRAPVSPKISPRERNVADVPGRAFCGMNSDRAARNDEKLVALVPGTSRRSRSSAKCLTGEREPMAFSSISRSDLQKAKKSRWTILGRKQESCREPTEAEKISGSKSALSKRAVRR